MGKKNTVGGFDIAAAFIGTVIGAGFVSGQELMQFFVRNGYKGIWGCAFVGFLFAYLSVLVMLRAKQLNTPSFDAVVIPPVKALRLIANILVCFFAFGTFVVMLAGMGALINEVWGLPATLGNFMMAAAVIAVALSGRGGMLGSLNLLVPMMIVVSLFTGVEGILSGTPIDPPAMEQLNASITGNWAVSALLFVSYNMSTALAVLAPLGQQSRSKKSIWGGGIVGGLVLGGLATLLCTAMLWHYPVVFSSDMPMLHIARLQGKEISVLYILVLLAGIFTTAVGILFALAERFAQYKIKLLQNERTVYLLITAVGLICSKAGFRMLVTTVYPLCGYFGLFIIFFVVYSSILSDTKTKQQAP